MVKRLSLVFALASLFLLSGCGGGGASSVNKPIILFMNASTDSGTVDFRMDDTPRATNLAYAVTNASFTEVDFKGPEVDGWDVSLHINSNGNEIERQAIVFGNDTDNIVIAHGLRNFGTEQLKRLRFNTFTVDRTIPNGNKAKLIVFHGFELATGFDTPNVTFKTPGDNAQFSTPEIAPGTSSVITTDSGTLTFEARRSGTDGVYATQTQNLKAGGVYLVLISGVENDPTPANQIRIKFIELPGTL